MDLQAIFCKALVVRARLSDNADAGSIALRDHDLNAGESEAFEGR